MYVFSKLLGKLFKLNTGQNNIRSQVLLFFFFSNLCGYIHITAEILLHVTVAEKRLKKWAIFRKQLCCRLKWSPLETIWSCTPIRLFPENWLESIFEVWTKVPTSYKHICFLLLCMNLILLGAEVFKIEQWYCVLCVKMPYLTLLSNNSRETLESSVVISKTWKWQFVNCSVTSVISISCTPDVNLKMMVHV